MEKITRFIKKQRRADFEQIFPFTTYDIIFDDQLKRDCPKSSLLFLYLERVFIDGIPGRDKSASQMPKLMIDVKEHFNHKFSKLAKAANYRGQGHKQHAIVERYFMDNHPDCIATEFPLFDEIMTAFGDILLTTERPFTVTVLDFKPEAHNEKQAPTQLFYIRKLLALMTGIDVGRIDCFYFDDLSCFEVLFNDQKPNAKA